MERHELAERCARIEKIGESVRDFLKDQGFVSPWGTWYRLQIEELGRKGPQITEGRGRGEMKRLTREQKEKCVQMALDGDDPTPFLRTLGSKNPGAVWLQIRKVLQETNPELYQRLTAKDTDEKPEEERRPVTTCCVPAPESGVEVPDELPDELPEEAPDAAYLDGFWLTGIKKDYGEYYCRGGFMRFVAGPHDELELPVDIWKRIRADLPRAMKLLGIDEI